MTENSGAGQDDAQVQGAQGGTGSALIVLGQISGIYGVHGWIKIHSYTEPRENILSYTPWQICVGSQWQPVTVLDGRSQGKGVIAHLEGWNTPETARALLAVDIAVPREQLPVPGKGEYYWSDLIGLVVITVDNTTLGTVDSLMETGANDVLVVQAPHREEQSGADKNGGGKKHLIPFVDGVIVSVDLAAKVLRVDWDVNY